MGTVKVLFFAYLKEQIGKEEIVFTGVTPLPIKQFLVELEKTLPRGILQRPGVQMAINREIASPEVLLQDGDEVAFLPPFSGG